jgi:hypothetical protein
MPKVYWATPTYGIGVQASVYHNHLAVTMIAAMKHGIRFAGASVTQNQLVWAARNNLVESVLKDPAVKDEDYIWWVDSDMILGSDSLRMLLSHDKDVVTGVYYQKAKPFWPLIMMKLPFERREGMHTFLYDYPKGLYRVDAIGFGCVITRVGALKKMEPPWFDWKVESGEDIYFCIKAKEKGIEIWADTNVTLGHVGESVVITEKDFVSGKSENFQKIGEDTYIVKEDRKEVQA